MSQGLRITFDGKDYRIGFVNPELLHQQSEEVVVVSQELTFKLVRTGAVRVPKSNDHADLIGLAATITKTIALKYLI